MRHIKFCTISEVQNKRGDNAACIVEHDEVGYRISFWAELEEWHMMAP